MNDSCKPRTGLAKYIFLAAEQLGLPEENPELKGRLLRTALDMCWREYCEQIELRKKEARSRLIQSFKKICGKFIHK